MPEELVVRRLGRVPYAEARALQGELVQRRAAGEVPDHLLLLEHPSVVTLGRATPAGGAPDPAALAAGAGLADGPVEVVAVERGGEATWHGPGQLVAYPLRFLPPGSRDLHAYLRDLEQVVIDVLAELGLAAGRRAGLTGVWLGERKVCSIGVAVRRWVTWHGLALNVANDLEPFRRFRPCGLDPAVMTRVADHAALPAGDPLLDRALERHFRARFGYGAA